MGVSLEKVVGLIKSVASEMVSNSTTIKTNLNATSMPTSSNDSSEGYSTSSTWIYDGITYTCTDSTIGNAIWSSSADLFYFDTWDLLVSAISVVGTSYVGKYATVSNANGGVPSGVTYVAPNSVANPIVDGGQATYKILAQGTEYSVTCQVRTITNPVINSVMTVVGVKPTVSGYYIFSVIPTGGLPIGVNLNDIAYYNGVNWSKFQSYAVANAVIIVGTTNATQIAWRKQGGSWVSTIVSPKVKKITGTMASAGGNVTPAHGLNQSKIIGFTVQVLAVGGILRSTDNAGGAISYSITIESANIKLYTSSNGTDIAGRPFTVLITYEE